MAPIVHRPVIHTWRSLDPRELRVAQEQVQCYPTLLMLDDLGPRLLSGLVAFWLGPAG